MAARRIVFELNPRTLGGTETFHFNLIRHLDPKKIDPLLLFSGEGKVVEAARAQKIPFRIFNYLNPEGSLAGLVELLKAEKAELAQSSYFSYPVALAAAQMGLPHVWRVGGHIKVVFPSMKAVEAKNVIAMMRKLSAAIVCPTRFLASQFHDPKIRVIHNGVTVPPPALRAVRDEKEFLILMVANYFPQKRHVDLIGAMARLKRKYPYVRAILLGASAPDGPYRDFAKEIRKAIDKNKLAESIEMAEGGVDRFRLFAKADAFVLPSEDEGSSNAIVEAMALGRPVVISRSGGNPELAEDKKSGIFFPVRNVAKLAQALESLIRDPNLGEKLGVAARKRVETKFAISHAAKQYQSFYLRDYRPAS